MSVKQAANGYFFGKFKDRATGKWKTKFCPKECNTEELAQNFFDAFLTQLDATDVIPLNNEVVPVQRLTIEQLKDKWLEYRNSSGKEIAGTKKTGKETKRQYEHHLKNWILPHKISRVAIDTELDVDLAREFLESLTGAPRTRRNIRQTVKTFIHDARYKGWVKTKQNVFSDEILKDALPKMQSVAGPNVIIQLSRNEASQLLASTTVPNERLIRYMVATLTGARSNEINGLKFADIDFTLGVININGQLDVAGTVDTATFMPCKKDSERTIPIHSKLMPKLKDWMTKGWQRYVGRAANPMDPVFPSKEGTFYKADFADYLRKDLALSGLSTLYQGKHAYTFHALRRTFATVMTDAKVGKELVSGLLGHKGTGVADRHYIARNLPPFKDAIESIVLDF